MTALALSLAWAIAEPPPGDAYRLPPFQSLRDGRLFNQRYQKHLQGRLDWEPYRRDALNAALIEARELYEVWDCAEGAHPDYPCPPDLKACYHRRLRRLLGPDDYRRMNLPPCVPTWRFNELR